MMNHAGIDLGKSGLHLSISARPDPPRKWPVFQLSYKEPGWDAELRRHIPPGAVVAIESTGWHYMLPVVQALEAANCVLWQVPTTTTGKIRAVQVSGGKSDQMDARALAVAATWIADGECVRGAYPYSEADQVHVAELRSYILAHQRAEREKTRVLNRLDQLGFSIWPSLVQHKETWLRALIAGAVTPAELRALAQQVEACNISRRNFPPGYEHGNARKPFLALVNELPSYVTVQPAVADAIRALVDRLPVLTSQSDAAQAEVERLVLLPPFEDITRRWLTVPEGSLFTIASLHVASNARVLSYSVDEFKTAVGAAPQRSRSGSIDRKGKLRPGFRPAMVATWFWTSRLVKPGAPPNPVRDYYEQVSARNHPYAFKAAIAKLIRVLWGVAQSHDGYIYNSENSRSITGV